METASIICEAVYFFEKRHHPDERNLTIVYFRPGTQSLGLTTEDLFWTGNIRSKRYAELPKSQLSASTRFTKNKNQVLSPGFYFVFPTKRTGQFYLTKRISLSKILVLSSLEIKIASGEARCEIQYGLLIPPLCRNRN
ncbi:MAG TPA: hypothetical protein VFX17_03640 [Patescibacteria group bacterium]|nr:hypothetical protein [Patescibacteria group bacterium]